MNLQIPKKAAVINVAIAVQVVLRPFDFGHYMFLELDQCRGVDHHEVDILRAVRLFEAARLFAAGLAVQQVDGRGSRRSHFFDDRSSFRGRDAK